MAEEILVYGVEELLKTLTVQVANEIRLAWGVEGDLKKLQKTLSMIQTVLEDADEKQQAKDRAVGEWLKRVKDVAYDAEDVMGEFSYEASHRRLEIKNRIKKKVRNFFSRSNTFAFHLKMAHKIKDINAKLDQIVKDMKKLEIIKRNAAPAGHLSSKNNSRETISIVDHSEIVGRDEEKKKLVAMLTDPSNNQDDQCPALIPIVGIGGLGKTTLAQLVYNDERVQAHFTDLKMWVCVSDDFNVKKLVGDIIKSAGGSRPDDDSSLEMMACKLQENLGTKKFLLVLDDVWNEDPDQWEALRKSLLCGAKGSKIIVTTRSKEVAEIMGTLPPHNLKALSDDESWSLFRQRAFGVGGGRGDEETESLVAIGKKIVEKCKGVPLAVKAIGSLLYSKRDERDWLSILENELWDLPDDKNKILPALRLSYDHLPSHLKPCFSFCSIFTKDEIIVIDALIQLWMVEGLLQPQPQRGNILMEDVGREYFKELLSSSFLQEHYVNQWGHIYSCKMHDLFHDLALSVSRAECIVLNANTTENISEMRCLRVDFYQKTPTMQEALDMASKLSVIFMPGEYLYTKPIIDDVSLLMKFKSLRVLVLRHLGIKELPNSMVLLKHLRFLELENIDIEVLPMWITSLYNLQTIKVHSCSLLKQLPSSIEKLINLRHFEIYDNYSCCKISPKGIGQLRFVQTIREYWVGKEKGCQITELKHLNHLRGTLELKNLENVRSREDAESSNLKQKQGIYKLVLRWGHERENNNIDGNNGRNEDEVLEGLQPPLHLKGLEIFECKGVRCPTWLTPRMLPNLVNIKITRSFSNCEELPAFGLFKRLKNLSIDELLSLKRIGKEFYEGAPFPSLCVLTLRSLVNLEEWVEVPTVSPSSSPSSSFCSYSRFPLLEELQIFNCPNLRIVPSAFPSLEKLVVMSSNSTVVQMLGRIKLPSLTSLDIRSMLNLTELPQGLLQNKNHVQSLTILGCPLLQTFNNELQYLTALEDLTIGNFSKELNSLPFLDGEDAEESSTDAIQQDQLPFCNSLRRLSISTCTLPSLPKRLQHFTALQHLRILDFPNMEALPDWLGNLSSLQELQIHSCVRLMHMPSAEAMRRLSTLNGIYVYDCPCLEERCAKDKGQEWYKISHIPNIVIDSEYIQYGGS